MTARSLAKSRGAGNLYLPVLFCAGGTGLCWPGIKALERLGSNPGSSRQEAGCTPNVLRSPPRPTSLPAIAWAVLATGRRFELTRTDECRASRPRLILRRCPRCQGAAGKRPEAKPKPQARTRPPLTAPLRRGRGIERPLQAGTKELPLAEQGTGL